MKIEAVIVCAGYADYLAETLPHNLPHFDRVVVVTSEDDPETVELCRRLSTECYAADVFRADGGRFNKYRGLEFGHMMLRHHDWVVNLDADTYLPPLTRQFLELKLADRGSIYGVDRVNCVGFDRWRRHLAQAHTGNDYNCRTPVPSGMSLGARISFRDRGGYCPIGYFQAWHATSGRRQPIVSGTAEHGDVAFAMQWQRRQLVPEVIALHLMADVAELGANWKGRTTKRFGPGGR